MTDRSRWGTALVLPVFGAVFLAVRTLWRAYVNTLSESELHHQVFDRVLVNNVALWSLILALTLGITWTLARILASRGRAGASDAHSGDRRD